MYRYVDWERITITGNDVAEEFIEKARLNSIDATIIEDRRDRKFQYITAEKIGKSSRWINDRVKILIEKYKLISENYPDIFYKIEKTEDFRNKCEYQNVNAIITLKYNELYYSIEIIDGFYPTFADMRVDVINMLEEKYGRPIEDIEKYQTFISGNYTRKQS